MAKDPYKYFRLEARELLEGLTQGVLELERGARDSALIQKLLRLAHTLKGAARVVKQTAIADVAHAMEDVLAPYREGQAAVERAHASALFGLLDRASSAVSSLGEAPAAPAPEAAPVAPPSPRPDSVSPPTPPAVVESAEPRLAIAETVRIEIAEMDGVLDGIAESGVRVGGLRQAAEEVSDAQRLLRTLAEELAQPAARARGSAAGSDRLRLMAEELGTLLERGRSRLEGGIEGVERELEQLQDRAARLRLVAANTLFAPLSRAVRDAAQTLGRRVHFEAKGGEVRLEAHVLAGVRDALLHVVRNAVAHGIESETDRRAAGKDPQGHVRLEVERRGDRAAFTCRDDGRGIDLDAVRRAAAESGLLGPAEVEALDMDGAAALIFRAGMSTRAGVDAVSGRGVGLDVVREFAARFKGEARARSEPGRGTTVEISVPLSLSSLPALSLQASGLKLWVPLDGVARTVRVAAGELARSANGTSLLHQEEALPFLPLSDVLPENGARGAGGAWSAAVVRAADGRRAAVGVDRFLGVRQVVVRPLPRAAGALPLLAGAVLDAEGRPQLMLDPDGLVEAARSAGRARDRLEAERRPPILIVDDSLTTRMLEQSILEAAGYEVDLAVCAEEGLDKAEKRRYGLFLVDVEMPGMDGFEFVARAKQDPKLRDVPSILVTSLNSAEDRRRGMEAGAHAHIVKGEFDERRLRQLIQDLIG
jgi:two-component system, chemotaxis family, sensor kinase CheA